jgi:hypothetical protein
METVTPFTAPSVVAMLPPWPVLILRLGCGGAAAGTCLGWPPPHPIPKTTGGGVMWPWRRRLAKPRELRPGEQWPDGDEVLHPGSRRSADILREMLNEPTQLLDRPLMTRGQEHRSRGGR